MSHLHHRIAALKEELSLQEARNKTLTAELETAEEKKSAAILRLQQDFQRELEELNKNFIDLVDKCEKKNSKLAPTCIAARTERLTASLAEQYQILSSLEVALDRTTSALTRSQHEQEILVAVNDGLRNENTALMQRVESIQRVQTVATNAVCERDMAFRQVHSLTNALQHAQRQLEERDRELETLQLEIHKIQSRPEQPLASEGVDEVKTNDGVAVEGASAGELEQPFGARVLELSSRAEETLTGENEDSSEKLPRACEEKVVESYTEAEENSARGDPDSKKEPQHSFEDEALESNADAENISPRAAEPCTEAQGISQGADSGIQDSPEGVSEGASSVGTQTGCPDEDAVMLQVVKDHHVLGVTNICRTSSIRPCGDGDHVANGTSSSGLKTSSLALLAKIEERLDSISDRQDSLRAMSFDLQALVTIYRLSMACHAGPRKASGSEEPIVGQ